MTATMRSIRRPASEFNGMEPCAEITQSFYDHAQEHLRGAFPDFLPMEQAYVHIGMYLGWVIETGLYSDYFEMEASTEIFRFRRKEISCTILSEIWNGYLAFEFLNKRGNSFTLFYYASGLYRHDYEEVLSRDLPSIYHVEDSWPNYEILKERINTRYAEWVRLKKLLEKSPCQVEIPSRLGVAV